MDKIHIDRITKITAIGIYYWDDRGDECVIEFEPCANSYDAAHNIQRDNSVVKCVGERFFGDYAYYELYTIGHTQLYMNLKTNIFARVLRGILNFHTKQFSKFYSIQKQLNAVGYTTLDLS